jgi:hypothetical protein
VELQVVHVVLNCALGVLFFRANLLLNRANEGDGGL